MEYGEPESENTDFNPFWQRIWMGGVFALLFGGMAFFSPWMVLTPAGVIGGFHIGFHLEQIDSTFSEWSHKFLWRIVEIFHVHTVTVLKAAAIAICGAILISKVTIMVMFYVYQPTFWSSLLGCILCILLLTAISWGCIKTMLPHDTDVSLKTVGVRDKEILERWGFFPFLLLQCIRVFTLTALSGIKLFLITGCISLWLITALPAMLAVTAKYYIVREWRDANYDPRQQKPLLQTLERMWYHSVKAVETVLIFCFNELDLYEFLLR